jgi:MYXO-CTERM domain-containing protein
MAKVSGLMVFLGALALALWSWPGTARAITCEDARGSCELTVDGNEQMGSCRCADCSPEVGVGGGGGEPLPEPTEEDCLDLLATMCTEPPVTDAADVCSPDALALCQGGLVDYFMTCGGPTNREEELCITVACCEEADEIGIGPLTELWECVSQYDDCTESQQACGGGEGDTGFGGDDAGGEGDANDGDDTDASGCSCSATPGDAGGWWMGVSLLGVVVGLRRRR